MNNRMQPDATSPYFVFQKRGLFCLWIVIIIYVALSSMLLYLKQKYFRRVFLEKVLRQNIFQTLFPS